MTDTITLPYWMFFSLVFVAGIATYICGIFCGKVLVMVYAFVQGFFRNR